MMLWVCSVELMICVTLTAGSWTERWLRGSGGHVSYGENRASSDFLCNVSTVITECEDCQRWCDRPHVKHLLHTHSCTNAHHPHLRFYLHTQKTQQPTVKTAGFSTNKKYREVKMKERKKDDREERENVINKYRNEERKYKRKTEIKKERKRERSNK